MESVFQLVLVLILISLAIVLSEIVLGDAKPLFGWRFWLWEWYEDRKADP